MTNDEMNYKMNNGRMDEHQPRVNGGGQQDMGKQFNFLQRCSLCSGGIQSNGAGSAGTPSGPGSISALSMKERKKSLMTRLIPGRNAPSGKFW
jgi:hypothetical protein